MVLWFRTRQSGVGERSSVGTTRIAFIASNRAVMISGISTKWSSASMAESTGYGVLLIRTDMSSMKLSRAAAIPKAARRLLKRLLKKQGIAPKRMITDKLRSYGAARRQFIAHVEHRSHKGLNNRAENSHVPLRKRERVMQGFRSPGSLQRFVSIFSAVRNLFVPPRTSRFAFQIQLHRLGAMAEWKTMTKHSPENPDHCFHTFFCQQGDNARPSGC